MRFVPMFKEDANKRPWSGKLLRIIAVLSIIGGVFEGMLIDGIFGAVFIFALANIGDYLHEIACYTRGYFVVEDAPEPPEWDGRSGDRNLQ